MDITGSIHIIPVNPAPAAPNKEAITATPAVVPRTAALLAPITALAPAATNGAASPPVTPREKTRITTTTINDHDSEDNNGKGGSDGDVHNRDFKMSRQLRQRQRQKNQYVE